MLIVSRKIVGAAPVPPPRPSRMAWSTPRSSAASRSSSTCWADIFTPTGMPPERSRLRSTSARASSNVVQSTNRAGETAGVPSAKPRTSAIRPTTFDPGR